jgi:hypothetical protein
LRCAFTNIGDNAWNLVAAVYWTLVGVGQEATAKEYLDIGYEHICTCSKDVVTILKELVGIDMEKEEEGSDPYAGACSEKAAVSKADAEAGREKERQSALDQAAEEERIAEASAAAQAAENALVGKNAAELEVASNSAFEAFQAKALELDAKDAPSEDDKQELEELRRAYEATKTAKANIVREGIAKELWDARAASGLDGLRGVIASAGSTQLGLAKIAQEFPKDEDSLAALGAAETQVLLLTDELLVMAQSTEVSVREATGIEEIAQEARNAEAYNRLYAQALPLARAGNEDTLDLFFGAIKQTLNDTEKLYNYAVAENAADAVPKGRDF